MVDWNTVRSLASELPGVEQSTSYGTPALKVRGKLLARLREDGETLVIKVDEDVRDALVSANPDTFFVTDHYAGYPYLLVRLANVRVDALRELIEQAWRLVAPKRIVLARGS